MKDLHKTVFPKIAAEWKIVADYLNYDIPTINLIAETGKEDPMKCCIELFTDWLSTDNGLAPKTWSTLIKTVAEIDQLSGVAEQIENSLKSNLLLLNFFCCPCVELKVGAVKKGR